MWFHFGTKEQVDSGTKEMTVEGVQVEVEQGPIQQCLGRMVAVGLGFHGHPFEKTPNMKECLWQRNESFQVA